MGTSAVKALEATADADFYATSLRKPAELAIKAARSKLVAPEVEPIARKYVLVITADVPRQTHQESEHPHVLNRHRYAHGRGQKNQHEPRY
jgi:hypothetical protein